jgi:hypothetical protein
MPLRVMDGASGIGADLVDFAFAIAIRDDGLGGELARLVLRPLRLFLVLRFLRRDGDVLATRHNGTSLLRLRVARADLNELGFGGDRVGYMRVHLRLIAGWVRASVLLAEFRKEELVVSCAFGAVHTTPSDGDEMRVLLVERSILEDEQDVLLNPRLQVADGEKNALGLAVARCTPILAEASLESFFLLVERQLRSIRLPSRALRLRTARRKAPE